MLLALISSVIALLLFTINRLGWVMSQNKFYFIFFRGQVFCFLNLSHFIEVRVNVPAFSAFADMNALFSLTLRISLMHPAFPVVSFSCVWKHYKIGVFEEL